MHDLLTFDAESHTYRYDGKVVPSVTEILKMLDNWEFVDRELLERASRFGTHVHQACALHVRDELDWDSLDPALEPYLIGFQKFLREVKGTVLTSEQPVYHAGLGYAGTLDLELEMKGIALADIKTGVSPPKTVGPQTIAYAVARHGDKGKRMPRYCLCLGDNTYRLHRLTDPNDWNVFVSCRNVYRFKHGV